MSVRLLQGDAMARLQGMEAGSIDACVSDPPYGLEFMSVAWDTFNDGRKGGERTPNTWGDHGSKEHPRNAMQAAHVRRKKSVAFEEFSYTWAVEVLRVLKPGGYLLAFGGTRTYHRLTCAIEDAGFEVRDCLMWLYGSGFPKGKGCLKPAWEPIVLARKPAPAPWLNVDACRIGTESTLRPMGKLLTSAGLPGGGYGAGQRQGREARAGIGGSDAGRWPANVVLDEEAAALLDEQTGTLTSGANPTQRSSDKFRTAYGDFTGQTECTPIRGAESGGASRFFYCAKASPAERRMKCACYNQAVWESGDQRASTRVAKATQPERATTASTMVGGSGWSMSSSGNGQMDLFQTDAKSTTEITTSKTTDSKISSLSTPSPTSDSTVDASCETVNGGSPAGSAENSSRSALSTGISAAKAGPSTGDAAPAISARPSSSSRDDDRCPNCGQLIRSDHPTVKPLALMQWLVRLVTPAGGTVLDPFCGSGSTLIAADREGFDAIGIDSDPHAIEIAERRSTDAAGMFADVEVLGDAQDLAETGV